MYTKANKQARWLALKQIDILPKEFHIVWLACRATAEAADLLVLGRQPLADWLFGRNHLQVGLSVEVKIVSKLGPRLLGGPEPIRTYVRTYPDEHFIFMVAKNVNRTCPNYINFVDQCGFFSLKL